MQTYDVIVVLGSEPDPSNWQFPSHVFRSLDEAAELILDDVAPYVAVSGKWALALDEAGQRQPFLEGDAMKTYLLGQGVVPSKILEETESEDTISNFYYLKKNIMAPRNMKRALLITADFRLERIEYLAHKILGPDYEVTLHAVPAAPGEAYPHETETFVRTQAFLQDMAPGDHTFLHGKFYDDPYYHH